MKKFLEIYLMPNFPDTKFRVSLNTVKLTRLSSEMDKKCDEKWNICANVKLEGGGSIKMFCTVQKLSMKWI